MKDIKKFEENIDEKLDRVMNEILEKEKKLRDETMEEIKKKKKHRTDPKLWEKLNNKKIEETFGDAARGLFIKDERLDEVINISKENMENFDFSKLFGNYSKKDWENSKWNDLYCKVFTVEGYPFLEEVDKGLAESLENLVKDDDISYVLEDEKLLVHPKKTGDSFLSEVLNTYNSSILYEEHQLFSYTTLDDFCYCGWLSKDRNIFCLEIINIWNDNKTYQSKKIFTSKKIGLDIIKKLELKYV